jgi:hypothetical protein
MEARIPSRSDLREGWWTVGDQADSGAGLGWAAADSVIRWHLVKAGRLARSERLSARHLWLAAKEIDAQGARPSVFIETEGCSIKAALEVARKWGVVRDSIFPSDDDSFFQGDLEDFYAAAANLRIASYFNLDRDTDLWRRWIALRGPILAAVWVDPAWDQAGSLRGRVGRAQPDQILGGHAVAIVGYTEREFLVRNTWGPRWGDDGYAHMPDEYICTSIFDAYGVIA